MNEKAVLELNGISFKYSNARTPILKDINLTVNQGEIVTIYGRNGCGKSTLLKLIYNDDVTGYDGDVYINGKKIENKDTDFYSKISYFRQQGKADNWHTVKGELEANSSSKEKVQEILEYFKFKNFSQKRISSLSGGEKQLVYLMEAFLKSDSDLILLDEPVNNLDGGKAKLLNNYIREFISKNPQKAVVIVTHCRMFPNVKSYELTNGVMTPTENVCHTCYGDFDENGYYDVSDCEEKPVEENENSIFKSIKNWFSKK